jgi:CheY-like chemotaxis protein
VEDNVVNQRLAIRVLQKLGFDVTVADNGLQAVIICQRKTFDLILMDVQMPEMGGFEATAKIREIEARTQRRTPIIAMTAHAIQGYREKCLSGGMDGYISKPIRIETLRRTIEEMLAKVRDGNFGFQHHEELPKSTPESSGLLTFAPDLATVPSAELDILAASSTTTPATNSSTSTPVVVAPTSPTSSSPSIPLTSLLTASTAEMSQEAKIIALQKVVSSSVPAPTASPILAGPVVSVSPASAGTPPEPVKWIPRRATPPSALKLSSHFHHHRQQQKQESSGGSPTHSPDCCPRKIALRHAVSDSLMPFGTSDALRSEAQPTAPKRRKLSNDEK